MASKKISQLPLNTSSLPTSAVIITNIGGVTYQSPLSALGDPSPYKISNTNSTAIIPKLGNNTASGNYSNVAGGTNNTVSAGYASNVSGGKCNCASGCASTVSGGYCNTASSTYTSNVAGGKSNTASGYYSNVAGGFSNTASGHCSSVLGGKNNNTNNQCNTFILGSDITANAPDTTYVNNLFAINNIVIQGSLSAAGGATFANTVFTTTSALSVINLGVGPALYVYQASGPYDVASFVDGDGIEVLHVGNANFGQTGKIGINQSFPNKELTVTGEISATGIIYALSGNSSNWNSVYNSVLSNSASNASINYVNSNYLPLSGGTIIGEVNVLSGLKAGYGNLTLEVTKNNVSIYGSLSSNNTIYDSVGNSNQWNSVYSSYNTTSSNIPTNFYVNSNFLPLSGGAMTGRLSAAANAASAKLNIGNAITGGSSNPTDTINGDVWINSGNRMAYKAGSSVIYTIALTNSPNAFTTTQTVDLSSNTVAMRITQRGSGEALRIEDDTTPDSTAFIVGSDGSVGIGLSSLSGIDAKLTVVGNISSTNIIYASNGNSNQWNSVYTSWNSASATSVVSYNDTRFSKLSSQAYQLISSTKSIIPINGNNIASGEYSNVVGGINNTASGWYTSVGGYGNTASGRYSTVAGGRSNTASGCYSNVVGGYINTSSGCYSNVAGGRANTASNYVSNVAGGGGNSASGEYTNVAGGYQNSASGKYSNVAGGFGNTSSNFSSSVAGGTSNAASGCTSNVAGGRGNTASGDCSNVNGGCGNTASNYASNVAGGAVNTASGCYSNVAGGFCNTACGAYSIVGGGCLNSAIECFSMVFGGDSNVAYNCHSIIGGGCLNSACGCYSTIAGGAANTASGNYSNVAGGFCNTACGAYSTIGGGRRSTASGNYSTVSGGWDNVACGERSTVSGGYANIASGCHSTVGGGFCNIASGNRSAILGGECNNTNSQCNTFILGSNITALQPDFTYVNNLSSIGCVNASNINLTNSSICSFTNPVTAAGNFLIMNVNGIDRAIRLWEYTT